MNFRTSRLPLIFALAAAALCARAQETVVVSKPADLKSERANSFLANPQGSGKAGAFNAPRDIFKNYAPDNLGAPPPVVFNNPDPSVKEALDKRKNWTLLTPEQILGVQTPEQILGADKADGQKKLSLEERYLLRENRAANGAATNRLSGQNFWHPETENPFGQRQTTAEFGSRPRLDERRNAAAEGYFNQFLRGANARLAPDAKPDSAWASGFAQPAQSKPDPEQIAAMERFRAMMEPGSPTEKADAPTSFGAAVAPVRDPNMEELPAFNPAGGAVAALRSGIIRPTGIMPLPEVIRPHPTTPEKKPDWQAQLPPWMRDGPPAHGGNF